MNELASAFEPLRKRRDVHCRVEIVLEVKTRQPLVISTVGYNNRHIVLRRKKGGREIRKHLVRIGEVVVSLATHHNTFVVVQHQREKLLESVIDRLLILLVRVGFVKHIFNRESTSSGGKQTSFPVVGRITLLTDKVIPIKRG